MSFLKSSDPAKRDPMVKEYLELKKNIRDNLLSERTGELELRTDLSKFYKPITETQKATTREITEGLKPIREGIEKLPEAIQPIGEATGEEEEEEELIGEIAFEFLTKSDIDKNFGVRKDGGHHSIGDKHVIIKDNDIFLPDGTRFIGTPGLWELITSKNPKQPSFKDDDYIQYGKLMMKTNSIYNKNDPTQNRPKGNHKGDKWDDILRPIWKEEKKRKAQYDPKQQGYQVYQPYQPFQPFQGYKKKEGYEGKGVVVIPSDPNALLERLDLLLASQDAGHTGVGNELVSICDELKRQGVLDTKTRKK